MSVVPYYWVNPKNGRAYWRPNRRGMELGFTCVSLGQAGTEAERTASEWNAKLRVAREEDAAALGAKRPAARSERPQFVYFLQVGDRIKIGSSRRPFIRLQGLASALPERARRAIIVAGTRSDEMRLHARFVAYRTGGEWFVASRPLILTIGRCAMAGQVIHDGNGTEAETRVESPRFKSQIAKTERFVTA